MQIYAVYALCKRAVAVSAAELYGVSTCPTTGAGACAHDGEHAIEVVTASVDVKLGAADIC